MKLVLALVAFLSGLEAQQPRLRVVLPPVPYDYVSVRSPYGKDSKLLPPGNSPEHNPLTNAGATLGRVLFYDKRLSHNGNRSCASCHQQERAFAGRGRFDLGFAGRRAKRNSMSIANLRFASTGFFWDERARTLEEMVLMPIADPIEMGLDHDAMVQRLRGDGEYGRLFRDAFGDDAITKERVGRALAQFVRSMVSLRSKFDVGLAKTGEIEKDFANFTPEENLGKRMFLGIGRKGGSCAACHVVKIRRTCGCVIRPEDYGYTAILQSTATTNNGLDRKSNGGAGKFRPPSLRNIELTAPYMHDGRFSSLEATVRFYAQRVRDTPHLDKAMRSHRPLGGPGTPGPRALLGNLYRFGFPMNSKQRRALVAFLKTLTDREFVADPRFSDPFVSR